MRRKSIRHKRRNKNLILNIKTINIAVFLMTISFFFLTSMIMPKATISQLEKRELASLPKLTVQSFFSGDYFKGIDAFYNDHFPFRDKLLQLASDLDEVKGLRSGTDEIKIYTVN